MTNYTRIAGLVLAAVALTTTPALAQRNRGDGGGDRNGGDRQRAERAVPRTRESQRPNAAVVPGNSQPTYVVPRSAQPTYVVPRSAQPTYVVPRGARPTYVVPRSVRPTYVVPGYSYRPYVYRVPYGYRPYGYRPGWSLNLYFGAPYPAYGYAPAAGYGYYSLVPGHAYGAVRIVDAPRDAQVLVDGYYAGVVDDYDGVFQHLNLEAGTHRIEIQVPGGPPVEFDVRIRPGETVTYHAFGRY
jgi:hypothetical protein